MATPIPEREFRRIKQACSALPKPSRAYIQDDFVKNMMETVLDYQLRGKVVTNALRHYEASHWSTIRSAASLQAFLDRYPNNETGNRAAAEDLWGYRYSKRLGQLRALLIFFTSVGVTDQKGLRNWARTSQFERDFKGRVKGLAFAVYKWLVMRQGVETVKPDVHVKSFLRRTTGREFSNDGAVTILERVAKELDRKANELDWSIWESESRRSRASY